MTFAERCLHPLNDHLYALPSEHRASCSASHPVPRSRRLNFLQPAWQRTLFCVCIAAAYSGSAAGLILNGTLVGLFAALVIGTLTGQILRLWSVRVPLMVTFALLLTGLGIEEPLSGNERQLVDIVVGAGLISALWPSGGRRKRRAISAPVRQLTKCWSRAMPIR